MGRLNLAPQHREGGMTAAELSGYYLQTNYNGSLGAVRVRPSVRRLTSSLFYYIAKCSKEEGNLATGCLTVSHRKIDLNNNE